MFLYVIQDSNSKLYVGITQDLSKRLKTHNRSKGAKFTKYSNTFKLIYSEPLEDLTIARRREIQIKKWSRAKKIALAENNIEKLRKLSCTKYI